MSTKKSRPAAKRPSKKTAKKRIAPGELCASAPLREHFSHIAADLRALAVPIGDIEPDPRNARTHSQQNVAAIAASLKAFGQRRPLVVNRRNRQIEAGHRPFGAAQNPRPAVPCPLFVLPPPPP